MKLNHKKLIMITVTVLEIIIIELEVQTESCQKNNKKILYLKTLK